MSRSRLLKYRYPAPSIRPAFLRADPSRRRVSIGAGANPGIVYLVEDLGRPGVCKVGQTMQLRNRIASLSQGRRIRLVWYIPTNQVTRLEREFMAAWEPGHVGGEWFLLSPAQVADFRSLAVVNYKGLPVVENRGAAFLNPGDQSRKRGYRGYVLRIEVGEVVERVFVDTL